MAEKNVSDVCLGLTQIIDVKKSIRIPIPQSDHSKGEVDVIAVTDKVIFLIEVKNFSGDVKYKNNMMYQGKDERGDIFQVMKRKEDAFGRLLINHFQSSRPELKSLLVFANDNVKLDKKLQTNHQVTTLKNLETKLSTIYETINSEVFSKKKISQITELLDKLGTWDTVEQFRQLPEICDIESLNLNVEISRERTKKICFSNKRGWMKTLLLGFKLEAKVYFTDGSTSTFIVQPNDFITQIIPWEKNSQKNEIPVLLLKEVQFGYHMNYDWDNEISNSNIGQKEEKSKTPKKMNNQNKYAEGTFHWGSILAILDSGILVDIGTSKKVKGLISNKNYHSWDIVKSTSQTGSQIRVRIDSNKGPNKILLSEIEER